MFWCASTTCKQASQHARKPACSQSSTAHVAHRRPKRCLRWATKAASPPSGHRLCKGRKQIALIPHCVHADTKTETAGQEHARFTCRQPRPTHAEKSNPSSCIGSWLTFRSPVSGPAAAEPNLALACTDIRRRVCSLRGSSIDGQDMEGLQPHARCSQQWAGCCRCAPLPPPALLNSQHSTAQHSTAQHVATQHLTWTGRKSAAAWVAAGRWRWRQTLGTARSLERRSEQCCMGLNKIAPAWHTGLVSQGGTGVDAHGLQPKQQGLPNISPLPSDSNTRGRLI